MKTNIIILLLIITSCQTGTNYELDSLTEDKLNINKTEEFIKLVSKVEQIEEISIYDVIYDTDNYNINSRAYMVDLKFNERPHIKCTPIDSVSKYLNVDEEALINVLDAFGATGLDKWYKIGDFDVFVTISSIGLDKGYIKTKNSVYELGDSIDIGSFFKAEIIESYDNHWYEYESNLMK